MSPAAAAAFDEELRATVAPRASDGYVTLARRTTVTSGVAAGG